MKKSILFIVLLVAQLMVAQSKIYREEEVQTEPNFPGGLNKYNAFVQNNFKWVSLKEPRNITIDFTVLADGKIADAKIIQPVGSANEKEALRIVNLMPNWMPATNDGKKVGCRVSKVMYNPYVKHVSYNDGGAMLTIDDGALGTPTEGEDNNIYNTAGIEVKPEFPGGMQKFYEFFNANFIMPDEEDLNGKVFACFIVEKDGSLSDIKILREIGYGTGHEVIRILKMSPKWIPGMQNGKKVRVLYSMPFAIVTAKAPEKK